MKLYKNSNLTEENEPVELFVEVKLIGFIFWLMIVFAIGVLLGKFFNFPLST